MADIKWIKLATCMPNDEKMVLIDAMPERDTIHYLWIRLLIQAAKTNSEGEIFLSDGMPYTHKMLAVIFSRPLATIKLALITLSNLGMIEIAPDKVIRIVNWDKHQNIEGMEKVREQNRRRVENYREKRKEEKIATKINKEENHEVQALEENKNLDGNEAIDNLENSEEASTSTNINNAEETNADNNCTVTKNTNNVTQNESNVTVTEQNKKEIENKKKNKKEKKEIDKDKNIEGHKDNTHDLKNKSSIYDNEKSQSNPFENNNPISESAGDEDINSNTRL